MITMILLYSDPRWLPTVGKIWWRHVGEEQSCSPETLIFTQNMSPADASRPSKRKWDQPAPGEDGTTPKAAKTDESKTASEAAAAAAAIAAKIAAQFASGALGSGDKEHDAEFMQDIDINDVRNRYLLTRGSTQDQVCIVFLSFTNFQAV